MAFLALNGRLTSLLSNSHIKASTAAIATCILGVAYILARRLKNASPVSPIRFNSGKCSIAAKLENRHFGEYKMVHPLALCI